MKFKILYIAALTFTLTFITTGCSSDNDDSDIKIESNINPSYLGTYSGTGVVDRSYPEASFFEDQPVTVKVEQSGEKYRINVVFFDAQGIAFDTTLFLTEDSRVDDTNRDRIHKGTVNFSSSSNRGTIDVWFIQPDNTELYIKEISWNCSK